MPKLRNLRIVNARFNDGKNIYEDFRMPFHGYNTTFELVNGGGKSVLLMLLMQCILPKSALTPERPFKDMFHGGDENRTTHVLAEWELEKSVSDKKYLLTGFCAKKKIVQDEDSRNDEIQSFNYLYNYNKGNDFDIQNIPLCSYENKEFVVRDYSKTLALLKDKGIGYDIRITEKRREYQEWLKSFYLLESEWDLIKQINKRENHLKPHFANYKTSRTLVEGLLIRTIEDCLKDRQHLNYENNVEESSSIAEALFKSQESLKKLQEEQELLVNYDKLLSEVTSLGKANDRLITSFETYDSVKKTAAAQFNAHEISIQRCRDEIGKTAETLKSTDSGYRNLSQNIEKIELTLFNIRVNLARKKVGEFEEELAPLEKTIRDLNYHLRFSRATNKFILIKERELSIAEREKILINKKKNRQDLYEKINPLGKTLFVRISDQIKQVREKIATEKKNVEEIQAKVEFESKIQGKNENRLEQNRKLLENLQTEILTLERLQDELTQRQGYYPQVSSGLFLDDKITAVTKNLARLVLQESEFSATIESVKDQISEKNREHGILEIKIQNEQETITRLETELETFEQEKKEIHKVVNAYGIDGIESCLSHLENEIQTLNEKLIPSRKRLTILNQEIETVRQYGFSLTDDLLNSLVALQEIYPQTLSGAEYLKGIPEENRSEVLERAPWLPKTILLLDQFFKEIVRNPNSLPAEIQDSSIILTSLDALRANRDLTLGDVFIPHRSAVYLKEDLTKDKLIGRLRKELAKAEETLATYESSLLDVKADYKAVRSFFDRYPEDKESEKKAELSKRKGTYEENKKLLATTIGLIKNTQEILLEHQKNAAKNKEQSKLFGENLALLNDLKKNEEQSQKVRADFESATLEQKSLENSLRLIAQKIAQIRIELQSRNESFRQMMDLVKEVERENRGYQSFAELNVEILPEVDIDEIRSEYQAVKKVIDEAEGSVGSIESGISVDRTTIDEYTKDIQFLEISLEELRANDPKTSVSDDFLDQLCKQISEIQNQRDHVNDLLSNSKDSHHTLSLDFTSMIKQFQESFSLEYSPNANLLDSSSFDTELTEKRKEIGIIKDQIDSLTQIRQEKEAEVKKIESNFTEYRVLDSAHTFKNSMLNAADELFEPIVLKDQLERSSQGVKRSREQFDTAKRASMENISDIPVATEFKDTIKLKLNAAESLKGAEFNQKQLNEYSQIIHSRVEIHQKTVDALKEIEEAIVNQAFGMAIIYRDYLKDFPQMSKLDVDGKLIDMVRINFTDCTLPDDQAKTVMRRYIQDLNKGIRDGKITRQDLQKSFRPDQLVSRVMEMGKINVKIRKIDLESQDFQRWDTIKASDGQENTMYIIFLIALMSYIRNIVVGRHDTNTAKVLLLDNPFGSTGAFYLWEPIWSILKRNNIQLICSGHKISTKIREFFPVHHILTEEISKSGLRRVNIKVEATGEAKEILDRSQRKTILQWTGSS